jgi:hypothetical protein
MESELTSGFMFCGIFSMRSARTSLEDALDLAGLVAQFEDRRRGERAKESAVC